MGKAILECRTAEIENEPRFQAHHFDISQALSAKDRLHHRRRLEFDDNPLVYKQINGLVFSGCCQSHTLVNDRALHLATHRNALLTKFPLESQLVDLFFQSGANGLMNLNRTPDDLPRQL